MVISNAMSKKPGRNDPCSCGSGKKYVRCCLPRDEAAARERARQQTPFADAALDEPDFDEDNDLEAFDDVEQDSFVLVVCAYCLSDDRNASVCTKHRRKHACGEDEGFMPCGELAADGCVWLHGRDLIHGSP